MEETKVLYNGDCPICSREIASYARYAEDEALPLRFEALQEGDLTRWGVTPEDAAKRLHVLKDGQVYSGLDAFQILWSEMPRFAWLARVTRLPIIRPVAQRIYDYILAPLLYGMHRRRQSRL
ncbi:MAG: DUF393 domain-containing protein [Pseudomonadota bacterium]